MKRSLVGKAIVGLMLVALFVTACGSGGNEGKDKASSSAPASEQATPAESSAAPSESAESEAATKKMDAPLGEVEIPTRPVKIVTDGYLPELLVLGVKPVGSTQWELENKVIQDQIDGIANTGERSLEAILALEPDLIVTWISDKAILEQYEKIAPTLAIPYSHFPSIHETLTFLGEALGKQEEAKEWLAGLDQTAADARAKLDKMIDPAATFSLMGVFVVDKGFYVYGAGGYRGGEAIYTHLKLTPPAKQKEEMIGKEAYRQISYEVVDDYAGDYIFLDQGEMISEVWGSNEGIWKSLSAVKNDRVFQLDPDLFWGNDPISLKLQIEEITRMLLEKAGS